MRFQHLNRMFGNKGQSLVELAITLPILLVLAFATIYISFYIYDMSIYAYAANKALDKGIGIIISRDLTQDDVNEIQSDAVNYTNIKINASNPNVEVRTTLNPTTNEKKLMISIESDYICDSEFVKDILGIEPKISAKTVYVYK